MATDSTPGSVTLQEELLRRARARAGTRPAAPVPTAVHAQGPAPLSHAQRRMWLMDRLGQGGSLYSVPFATRLHGPLDIDALAVALTALVRRHAVLRTRYGQRGDEPYQETLPAPGTIAVPVVEVDGDGAQTLAAEARRPFDLAAGPLPRALVLRHGPQDHTVLLTFHHITIDGGSLETVADELAQLYAAAVDGRRSRTAGAAAVRGLRAPRARGGRPPRCRTGALDAPARRSRTTAAATARAPFRRPGHAAGRRPHHEARRLGAACTARAGQAAPGHPLHGVPRRRLRRAAPVHRRGRPGHRLRRHPPRGGGHARSRRTVRQYPSGTGEPVRRPGVRDPCGPGAGRVAGGPGAPGRSLRPDPGAARRRRAGRRRHAAGAGHRGRAAGAHGAPAARHDRRARRSRPRRSQVRPVVRPRGHRRARLPGPVRSGSAGDGGGRPAGRRLRRPAGRGRRRPGTDTVTAARAGRGRSRPTTSAILPRPGCGRIRR